ncbi:MAG: hypothetical protein SGILL_003138 [Bacillariaceae sp.]
MSGFARNPYNTNKNNNNNPYSNDKHAGGGVARSASPAEAMLRNLVQSPSTANVSSLQSALEQLMAHRDVQWTLDLALGLGKLLASQLREILLSKSLETPRTRHDNDNQTVAAAAALQLLVASMEDWDDQVLYAVLIQECGSAKLSSSNHLLALIMDLALLSQQDNTSSAFHQAAVNGVATTWRCLDRMQHYMSMVDTNRELSTCDVEDVPWWINEEQIEELSALSIESLHSAFATDQHDGYNSRQTFAIHQEQYRLSALTLVASLLRGNLLDMTFMSQVLSQNQLSEIASKLLKGIQVLNHSVLPPSSSEYTLPIALLSMSVLTLLQQSSALPSDVFHSLNQTIQSTRLVENVVEFSFLSPASNPANDASSGHVSRWILPSSKRFPTGHLQYFGLYVMSCWKSGQQVAWKKVSQCLAGKLDRLMEQFSSVVFQDHHSSPSQNHEVSLGKLLPGVVWLCHYFRHDTRRALLSIQPQASGTSSPHSQLRQDTTPSSLYLLRSLFALLDTSSRMLSSSRLSIARLLCLLLSDRRTVTTHDALSRSLWAGVDASVLEMHWSIVLQHISTEDNDQALLLSLLDVMEVLLEFGNVRHGILDKISAQDVEALIYLIKPKDVRYDFSQVFDIDALNIESETPPLNNLSRLDDASICVEQEDVKQPRGWDWTIRFSAATTLGRMSYGISSVATDESVGVLLSRTSTAVNDFVADCMKLDYQGQTVTNSLDHNRRLFRLQVLVAIPENEAFLSSVLHTSRIMQRRFNRDATTKQTQADKDRKQAILAKERADQEKQQLVKEIDSQRAFFQQSLSLAKTNTSQEARQIVSLHATERAKAEGRVEDALREAAEATVAVQHARADATRMSEEVTKAQSELAIANSNVEELNLTITILQQQLEEEKTRTKGLSDQVDTNQKEMESFSETHRSLQKALKDSEQSVVREQEYNRELHNNLEDLFADMCSLAQMYQHSGDSAESIEKKARQEIDEANKKLDSERKKNSELGTKFKLLEEECDKVYRKLAKYKEQLKQERNERKEEQEQRKEAAHRRKRNGPVSYLNSLHNSNISDSRSLQTQDKSTRQTQSTRDRRTTHRSSSDKSNHDKENASTSYYTNASQMRTQYK